HSYFLIRPVHPPLLHSFPTRRSSDLAGDRGIAFDESLRRDVRKISLENGQEPVPRVLLLSRRVVLPDPLAGGVVIEVVDGGDRIDRKSTRLNSSHQIISYAVFCLKKK